MKRDFRHVLLIFLMLWGCSREIEQELQPSVASSYEQQFESQVNDLILRKRKSDSKPLIRTKNQIGPPEAKTGEEEGRIALGLNQVYKENGGWREADVYIQEAMVQLAPDWDAETRNTLVIQGLHLRVIRDFLLPVEAEPQVNHLLAQYLDRLLAHQSVDTRILADAALRLKGKIAPEAFERYRAYILRTSQENLEWGYAELGRLKGKHDQATDPLEKETTERWLVITFEGMKGDRYASEMLDASQ